MEQTMMLLLLLAAVTPFTNTLDNGLALTPPMGWLSWERFRCNTNCNADPENCISEHLIKTMANHMVSDGYLEAGYEYIIIDDCWQARSRDSKGRLMPDPDRFPNGIKALSDYVHGKGLKFGIYEDFGTKTCEGYPGSEFYMETDANTFADWGVDYVKFDGCNSDPKDFDIGYPVMSFYLNKTGRPIVFSCEWPLYQQTHGIKPNYSAIQASCNLWRNHGDVQDSWSSVKGIINFYANDYLNFSMYAQPGAWNDPDMLIIGDFSLNEAQSRVQMAMWAIMASPLLMSNDLRNISTMAANILKNKNVIKINQDRLGKQGKIIKEITGIQIWSKPILPAESLALAFLQIADPGKATVINVLGSDLGLTSANGYDVTEVFSGKHIGIFKPSTKIAVTVDPTSVVLVTAIPV